MASQDFKMKNHTKIFFENCIKTTKSLSTESIEKAISLLISLKKRKGRLFILGVGGSAGHASHAVNDFRKLCDIESYSASDNISELTARVNDEGWDTSYVKWLKTSQLSKKDTLLFFSVGGGDLKKRISVNLIKCHKLAMKVGSSTISITGKKGYLYKKSHCSILINTNSKLITPITEGVTALIWHCFVSDKRLQSNKTTW